MGLGHYAWKPGEPIREVSLWEWATAFEKASQRRVAFDTVHTRFGDIEVSTVFLGLDHRFSDDGPPIVFETMTFGGPWRYGQEARYCTEAEARAGHATMLAIAKRARWRLDWWIRSWLRERS